MRTSCYLFRRERLHTKLNSRELHGDLRSMLSDMEHCAPGATYTTEQIHGTIDVRREGILSHEVSEMMNASAMSTQPHFRIKADSLNSIIEASQSEAHSKEFALVVQQSNAVMKIVNLCCDRFGTYTSVATKRKSTTKKCGCSFTLRAQQDASGYWEIIKQSGSHNQICIRYQRPPDMLNV